MNEQSDNSREKTFREAEKQIIRSAFLALAALAVIVFACYAWFVSSTSVTGTVGAVRIDGSSFELASVGDVGHYDDLMPADSAETGEDWQLEDGITGTITGEKSDILWRISDSSNLGNNQTGSGISPGSKGELQFYVVPKRTGELTLKFDIKLLPLNKDGKQITMNGENGNSTLNMLLRGHFLFFHDCKDSLGYDSENTPTLITYNESSFKLTFNVEEKNKPILVTLSWLWPEFLKDVVENQTTGKAIKVWMKAAPNDFFYIGDEAGSSIPIDPPDFDTQFRLYNNLYNNADEYIGTNVHSVILQLTAEEV